MYIVQAAFRGGAAASEAAQDSLRRVAVHSASSFKLNSRLYIADTDEYIDSSTVFKGRCWAYDGFDAYLAHCAGHTLASVQRDFLDAVWMFLCKTMVGLRWW